MFGQKPKNTNTMKGFELSMLAGVWYEIAHTEGKRLNDCDNVVINYQPSISKDTLIVQMQCFKNRVSVGVQTGKLTYKNAVDQSKLKVEFDGILSKSTDYWVYGGDFGSYAIVGTPEGYLWILSKEVLITPCYYGETILPAIKKAGLNAQNLQVNANVFKSCEGKR